MNWLREPVVLLLAAVVVGWGVFAGSGAPRPLPVNVPLDVFSAGRANLLLEELYADLGPHPSGTPANARLRDRIVTFLAAHGYEPEVQTRYQCNPTFAACAPVENIVAVLAGVGETDRAMLLTAHYDSGWAGPGVADDGAGVAAVLEIARMVARHGPFDHDLVFLVTDAEERGLIGAHAFATEHPAFGRVRAVINLEARGVGGPSAMFETAPGNRGVIRLLAKNLERPVANSLTWEMYRRMPNDTDFSVYRGAPVVGVNFAFVEGVAAYHSEVDDLERLDRGSLQHHGQNAWSVLRALDERTLDSMVAGEDAVYVDLFGRALIHYPVSTAAGLALVVSVLVLVAIRRSYRQQIFFRQILWSVLAVALLLAALPAAGWLLAWPLGRWPDQHALDHPWPWVGRGVLFIAAVSILQRAASWLARHAATAAVMMTCWALIALSALVLATVMPAAGFVPLLPLLAFMTGLALDGLRWSKSPRLVFSGLFGFIAALYIGFYLAKMLETVMPFSQSAIRIAPLALPAIAALPLLVWHRDRHLAVPGWERVLLAAVLAGCALQWFVPAYTPDRPRDMALHYLEQAGSAWMVLESEFGTVDAAYAARHGFVPVPDIDGRLAVPAAPLELPAVGVEGLELSESAGEPATTRAVLDLSIPPGVRQLDIRIDEAARWSRAEVSRQVAYDVEQPAHRPREPTALKLFEPPPGGLRIVLEWSGGGESAALALETRYDLPEARLRPFQEGWPITARPAFLGPRAMVLQAVLPESALPEGDP